SETLMWKGRIASLSAAATRFAGRLTVPTAAILLTTVPTKRRRSWSISSGILFESMDEIPSVHPSRSRCRPHALLVIQPDGHSDTEAREQQRKRGTLSRVLGSQADTTFTSCVPRVGPERADQPAG